MRLLLLLPILLLSLALNSCGLIVVSLLSDANHKEREARTAPIYKPGNGRVTSVEFHTSSWARLAPQSLGRINDKICVLAFQSSADSATVRCYNDTMGIVWQTLYHNREERSFWTCSYNGQVYIFSSYSGADSDTLAYIGRSFNAETGVFLRADTLMAVNTDTYNTKNIIVSANNSTLPVLFCAKPSVEQGDSTVINYTFYKISPDFAVTTRTVDITLSPAESYRYPTFALTATGDVLYTNVHGNDSMLYLSIIRLPMPSGTPDTLSVSASRYTAEGDELQPDDLILSVLPDGNVYAAWNIENDREAAFIRLIHCNFYTRKVSIFADIPFTERKNETLFGTDSFKEPFLLDCRPLTDGGLFVLFEDYREKTSTTFRTNPNGRGSTTRTQTYFGTQWLGAVCLNKDGSTRWMKSIARRRDTYRGEALFTFTTTYQQDSTIYNLAIDNDLYLRNIAFSLSDGTYTNYPFPLYTHTIFPSTLLWNTDGTALALFNINDNKAYIGRLYPSEIKVHPDKPQEQ